MPIGPPLQPARQDPEDLRTYATLERTPFFELARKHFRPGMAVLDIGAGNGEFARFLGEPQIHLIDGNASSVERLLAEFPNTRLHQIPHPLPFPGAWFDLIHCSHLVEHLQPQELYALVTEMDRTLKPGGFLVISAPMLWQDFYNDLSHVRPYNPAVFYHYLCDSGAGEGRTRTVISTAFRVVELKYRYYRAPLDDWRAPLWRKPLYRRFFRWITRIRRRLLPHYEVNGYTLVLQKAAHRGS